MRGKSSILLAVIALLLLSLSRTPAIGVTFTLSDAGLTSLDWLRANGGDVVDRRDVSGLGVEFDIYYPADNSPESEVSYGSSKEGGAGALAGIDISMYDTYELKFTLVAVDGLSSPGVGGVLAVGAYVGNPLRYHSRGVDFDPGSAYDTTVISSTTLGSLGDPKFDLPLEDIDYLGFYTRLVENTGWNPAGTTVTLLVEPAPGAVLIPEPATLLLLSFGVMMLRKTH